jgi:PadR family transcriptional regulator PadR
MKIDLENWKAQIRRGYLEMSILMVIKRKQRIYGFDLIEELKKYDVAIKDGTLYPLLNRLAADGVLHAT